MASINAGRVVAGALVGGVVASVCDTVWNMTVMKDDMAAMAQKFGMSADAMNSLSAALPWIAVDFIFGLLTVFMYAGIRPRFGPGPKTALIAGIPLYLAASAVVWGFTTMGMMSMGVFWKSSGVELVTTILGSLAGCAVYKEA